MRSLLTETSSLLTAGYNNLDSGYAFGYDSIAFGPMSDMISYQRDLVKHTAPSYTCIPCWPLICTINPMWDA